MSQLLECTITKVNLDKSIVYGAKQGNNNINKYS